MVVNFRTHGISRDTRKLTQTPMLKKQKRVTKKFSEKKNIFIKKISSFLGLTSLSLSLSQKKKNNYDFNVSQIATKKSSKNVSSILFLLNLNLLAIYA